MMKQPASLTLQGRHIRCLLFDLGETLWVHCDQATMERITEQQARQCATLLQTYIPALPPSISDYYQWSVQLRQAISKRYQARRYQDYEQEPDPILVTAEACQDASLPALESTQLACLFETFRPPLAAARILLDGTLETLQMLSTHGMLLGCVTELVWRPPFSRRSPAAWSARILCSRGDHCLSRLWKAQTSSYSFLSSHDSPQCLSRRNCRGWRLFEQGYRRSETTPDGGDLEAQRTTHSTGIHELSGGTTRRSASCRPLRRRIHVS